MNIPKIFRSNSILITLFLLLIISGCGLGERENKTNANASPQGLIANSGSRIVELSWSGVPSASAYTVYWSNNQSVEKNIANSIQTQEPYYQHRELVNGLNYFYIVSATTNAGESSISQEVVGSPEAAAPPQPDKLNFKPGNQRVTIDFDAVPGATSYSIYWSNKNGDTGLDNFTSTNRIDGVFPPFVHTGLNNGETHYYWLAATNEIGKSSLSKKHTIIPQQEKPVAPIITQAVKSNGGITLSWRDVGNAESFDLYWGNQKNISSSDFRISDIQDPFLFKPENGISNDAYYFKVMAKNSAGDSQLSNEILVEESGNVVITPAGERSSSPKLRDDNNNFLANITIEDRQLTLDWRAIEDSDKKNFNLYWKKGTEIFDNSISIELDDFDQKISNIKPPYTHIGLDNNSHYYYRLSIIDDNGESGLSELPFVYGKPEIVTPGIPTGVTAIGGDNQITVNWNPVQRATGYNIELIDDDLIVGYTNAESPFVIDNLENNKNYQVRVFVVNGNKVSEGSEAISSSPKEPAAHAIEVLTASPGNKEITLQWRSAQPQNPDDENESVSAYRVYYRTLAGVSPDNTQAIQDLTFTQADNNDLWQTTIPNLTNGQRYYFIVTAINNGGESQTSTQVWAIPQENIPNAPRNVFAEAADNQVTIHFTGIESETTPLYNLYWSKKLDSNQRSDTQVITNITQDPPYIFTDGNSNGTTYFFQVSATNPGGESILSSEVVALPKVPTPIITPSVTAVVPGSKHVNLSWDPVADSEAYHIYWSTDPTVSSGKRSKITIENDESTYQHTALIDGETYYYRLSISNAGGEGPLSDIYVAQPQVNPPVTPVQFNVEAGDSAVTVYWTADTTSSLSQNTQSTDDNEPLVGLALSHDLYWSDDINAENETWQLVRGVYPGYIINNLTNGVTYHFRMIAVNTGGYSEPTITQSATPIKPEVLQPDSPTGVIITASINKIELDWDTLEDINYRVYWSNNESTPPFNDGTQVDNVSPVWIHDQLNSTFQDQQYFYQVTAINEGGESVPSNVVSAIPLVIPDEPAETERANAPVILSSGTSIDNIVLEWLAPANAIEGISYTLYWSTQTFADTELSIANKIDNVSSPFTHTNLNNQSNYFYRLTATNPDTEESMASSLLQTTTLIAIPQTPSGLQVITGDSTNTILWNTTVNATQYIVEISSSAQFESITSIIIDAPVVSYAHIDIPNNQTVYYRIKARNSTGTSAVSNSANGTPQQIITNSSPLFSAAPTPTHNEGAVINHFSVAATDADEDTLIYGASGYPNGIIFNSDTATFSGTLPPNSGQSTPYLVTVTADDQTGEANATNFLQFSWQVNEVITDPAQSSVTILPAGNVNAGQTVALTIIAKDNNGVQRLIGGDTVTVSIQGANQAVNQTISNVIDNNDGTYQVSYTPTLIGQDNFIISINGTNINTPSRTIISADIDVTKTQLSATPGPFEVDDTLIITAHFFDAFDNIAQANSIEFNITGTNAQSITASYDSSTQSYRASYSVTNSGSDVIAVHINNTPVNNLSLTRTTNPITTNATLSRAIISPSTTTEINQPVTLTITTNDHRGIQRTTGGDNIVVTISGANQGLTLPAIQDSSNGIYQLIYTPVNAGTDSYTISINDSVIGGGPYNKTIIVSPLDLSKTQMTVTDGPITAGNTINLAAQIFDGEDNPTTANSVTFVVTGANEQNIVATYNSNNQRYEANFQATVSGEDSYTVKINNTEVPALSFTRTVLTAALDISNTQMTITPAAYSISTDDPINILIETRDSFGNPVYDENNSISIDLPYANNALTLAPITDNLDGTYTLSYQPENTGTEYINLDVNTGVFTSTTVKSIVGGAAILSTLQVNIAQGPFSVLHNYRLSASLEDRFGNPTRVNAIFNFDGANSQALNTVYTYNPDTATYNNYVNFTPSNQGTDIITLTIDDVNIDSVNETRTTGPNQLPIASAGADFVVTQGSNIMLNALHSTDPEGRNMTFIWSLLSKPVGSGAALDNNTTVTPSFIADEPGIYSFSLIANDGFDTSTNNATINIDARIPHMLDAPNTSATPYNTPVLNTNDNGDILATWRMTNGRYYKTVFSYKPAGGNWSVEEELFPGSGETRITNDGQNFMVVYEDDYNVYAKEFDGTNWSDEHSFGRYYYGDFDVKKTSDGYLFYGFYSRSSLRASHYAINSSTGLWEWSEVQNLSTISGYNSLAPKFAEQSNGNIMLTWSQRSYLDTGNVYELISIVNDNGTWTQPNVLSTGGTSTIQFKTQTLNNAFFVTHTVARSDIIDTTEITVYDIEAHIYSSGVWSTPQVIGTSRTPSYDIASNDTDFKLVWSSNSLTQNAADYHLSIASAEFDTSTNSWNWFPTENIETGRNYIYSPAIISNGNNYLTSWVQRTASGDSIDVKGSFYNNTTQSWEPSVNLEALSNNATGSIQLSTNNDGYIVSWAHTGIGSLRSLYVNVYDINTTTTAYEWKGATQVSINDTNYTPSEIKILNNGTGYALNWKQYAYENSNFVYGKYIAIYGNTGASNSWSTTQQIDGDGNLSSSNQLPVASIPTPNNGYQLAWTEDVNSVAVLYTSNINSTNSLIKTELIQGNHEGIVTDVKSSTNTNGNILIITRQYNAGKHQLYGQLYRNLIWEPQFMIANDSESYELISIGTDFYIIYDTSAGSSTNRNLFAVNYSETNGLSSATNLNSLVFNRGSYSNWRVSANENSVAVIWGRNGLYGSVYDIASGLWSPDTLLQSTSSSISYHNLTSGIDGFGVAWVTYDGTSYNGYANIFANGTWGGEQLIENTTQHLGYRDYEGAPNIASNGTSYIAVWAQDAIDSTTLTDIFTNTYNPTTGTWTSEVKIGDAGAYQIYPKIISNNGEYNASWRTYVSGGADNGEYNSFYQLNPLSELYNWTIPEKTNCSSTIHVVNNRFTRTCSNLVQDRIYNNAINEWEWVDQPRYPLNGNLYNYVFNNTGNYASTYTSYSSQLGRSLTYLTTYDAIKGWDTGRVMSPTNTLSSSDKIFNAGDTFSYQWLQTNEVDSSLLNAWIMIDLKP